jgi:hypothetical protein
LCFSVFFFFFIIILPCPLSLSSDHAAQEAYELVGVVLGLAIYNGLILDTHLPPVTWKKLLGEVRGGGGGVVAAGRGTCNGSCYREGGGCTCQWLGSDPTVVRAHELLRVNLGVALRVPGEGWRHLPPVTWKKLMGKVREGA